MDAPLKLQYLTEASDPAVINYKGKLHAIIHSFTHSAVGCQRESLLMLNFYKLPHPTNFCVKAST